MAVILLLPLLVAGQTMSDADALQALARRLSPVLNEARVVVVDNGSVRLLLPTVEPIDEALFDHLLSAFAPSVGGVDVVLEVGS